MQAIYLLTAGLHAKKNGGRLHIEKNGAKMASVPLGDIRTVVVARCAQLTTDLIFALMEKNVPITYVDGHGQIVGILGESIVSVERLRRQIRIFDDDKYGLALARRTVSVKITAESRLLHDYAKRQTNAALKKTATELKTLAASAEKANSLDELRGYEGIAAKKYFDCFPLIIKPPGWTWKGRSRRPAADGVNALLNYGYAFLEHEIRLALIGSRLDPRIGFLHSNNGRKDSLVFDIMEPYRARIIDRFILRLINLQIISPATIKKELNDSYRLNEETRRKWSKEYESFMAEKRKEYDGLTLRAFLRKNVDELAEFLDNCPLNAAEDRLKSRTEKEKTLDKKKKARIKYGQVIMGWLSDFIKGNKKP